MIKEYSIYNDNHKLHFDEEEHRYYLDGVEIPGVTTILEEKGSEGLIHWAVQQTLDAMENVMKPGTVLNKNNVPAMLKHASKARFRALHQAATFGTIAHNWMEEYADFCIAHDNMRPDVLDPDQFDGGEYPDVLWYPVEPEARSSVDAFLNWVSQHEVIFLDSEQKVVSVQDRWAGTKDVSVIVDGRRGLWDYKTSNGIRGKHMLQACTYACGSVEMGQDPYDDVWVLRVPKDGGEFEAQNQKDLTCGYSIQDMYEVFLGLKRVHDFNDGKKKRYKKLKSS